MILSNLGENEIIIGVDTYYQLSSGTTIIIKNELSIEKSLYLLPTNNDRYIYWDYTIVSGSTEENLPSGIIYLERGFYTIEIYNDTELIYTDNLFVNLNKETIYEIDDDGDIIYTIPN